MRSIHAVLLLIASAWSSHLLSGSDVKAEECRYFGCDDLKQLGTFDDEINGLVGVDSNKKFFEFLERRASKIVYLNMGIMYDQNTLEAEGPPANDYCAEKEEAKNNRNFIIYLPDVESQLGGCVFVEFKSTDYVNQWNLGTGMVSFTVKGFYVVRLKNSSKFDNWIELVDAQVPFSIRQSVD